MDQQPPPGHGPPPPPPAFGPPPVPQANGPAAPALPNYNLPAPHGYAPHHPQGYPAPLPPTIGAVAHNNTDNSALLSQTLKMVGDLVGEHLRRSEETLNNALLAAAYQTVHNRNPVVYYDPRPGDQQQGFAALGAERFNFNFGGHHQLPPAPAPAAYPGYFQHQAPPAVVEGAPAAFVPPPPPPALQPAPQLVAAAPRPGLQQEAPRAPEGLPLRAVGLQNATQYLNVVRAAALSPPDASQLHQQQPPRLPLQIPRPRPPHVQNQALPKNYQQPPPRGVPQLPRRASSPVAQIPPRPILPARPRLILPPRTLPRLNGIPPQPALARTNQISAHSQASNVTLAQVSHNAPQAPAKNATLVGMKRGREDVEAEARGDDAGERKPYKRNKRRRGKGGPGRIAVGGADSSGATGNGSGVDIKNEETEVVKDESKTVGGLGKDGEGWVELDGGEVQLKLEQQ